MDTIRIAGGKRLVGEVAISGAKNAALPILCASLLAEGTHRFTNVPDLRDVHTTNRLLSTLGAEASFSNGVVEVHSGDIVDPTAPYELVKQMRASVLVLGPLVARCGKAQVSLPGGCAIGARPIDQHLKGLRALGASIDLDHGYVNATVPGGRLRGADIRLDFPTHTGTENLMCAAALADGTTTISNAAREPEIVDLADMLNKMGGTVSGAGTSTITIVGKKTLNPVEHAIMADRIEAGTFMVAIAATQGEAIVKGAKFDTLEATAASLREMGVTVDPVDDGILVACDRRPTATDVITAPFPGFATDMQAQLMVLSVIAQGTSRLTETVFENRFMHVPELNRMGAKVRVRGQTATVTGVPSLQGAQVMATDLRASASLVIAGLVANGETEVRRVYHLDRGYEQIEKKLSALGGDVKRVSGDA
ncbi:MAG: UDP-N-acetylglucosamine 1-carboxyvinyltransferase [Polyangiales bacterium]